MVVLLNVITLKIKHLYKLTLSLLLTGFLLYSYTSKAQRGCGTVEYQKQLTENHPKHSTPEAFEDWLRLKITKRKVTESNKNNAIVDIPVVVHIIHNGEPLGTGKNISDAQIVSQIEVLNEDFRRTNEDRFDTPSVFTTVAADTEINFILAKRDPEGLASNGIVRVNGNRDLWELSDNYTLKTLSNWPADDYLNIWVTDLGSNYLGYAQFPVSDLGGLENSSDNALTDGVVIDYLTFGSRLKLPSADLKSAYDRGRTATHEIGHFLGLRHIWGDGDCNTDDYCTDTPLANKDHVNLSNCTYPGPNTCTNDSPDLADMFQNYMDYTDDLCMNLFTADQKTRMKTVLANSPRRASLTTSMGDEAPVLVNNDIGIRNILSPDATICGIDFTPTLEIRNYGLNNINQLQIHLFLDNNLTQTISQNINLAPLEIGFIPFESMLLQGLDSKKLTFKVFKVNNTDDMNTDNNEKEIIIQIPAKGITPIQANFNSLPLDWNIKNGDNLTTWELADAANGESNNKALFINFYNYENEGEIDLFSSPSIDLSTLTSAKLSFDVSYAMYPGITDEGLIITIGTNCVDPLSAADTVYYKMAEELKTVNNTSSEFVPASFIDWRSESIDLAPYLGENAVQITFIGKNGFGNNLYIDNISIDNVKNKIISPSPSSCNPDQLLSVEIVNNGSTPIDKINLSYTLDNANWVVETFVLSTPLAEGFSTQVSTALPNLPLGLHNLEVEIDLPNTIDNTILKHQFYIDQNSDFIPVKENFQSFDASTWHIVNPQDGITWELGGNSADQYVSIDNGKNSIIDAQNWLISPSLDFTSATSAVLTFEVAYANRDNPMDGLTLYVSTDCGESYFIAGYNKFGSDLTTTDFTDTPKSSDWRLETVDLSDYLDYDQIRIALVSTNKMSETLYLDNIQIFVTEYSLTNENFLFPNPTADGYFNIEFNLDKKEQVHLILYDLSGNLLSQKVIGNTLNQRYQFDMSNQPQGIYLLKVVGESFTFTRRVMKSQ